MYSIIFYINFELVFKHSDLGALGTPDSPCICINLGALGTLGSLYTRMNWMRSRFSMYLY